MGERKEEKCVNVLLSESSVRLIMSVGHLV